jgi:signal transduction histidine kinase
MLIEGTNTQSRDLPSECSRTSPRPSIPCGLEGGYEKDSTARIQAPQRLNETNDQLKKEIDARLAVEQELRHSEASLHQISRRLFRVHDDERKRLGRELHESIGQYLAAIKLGLESLYLSPSRNRKDLRRYLQENIALTTRCIDDIRAMAYLLYPPMFEEMGLKIVIPWYTDSFTKQTGIVTGVEFFGDFSRLPNEIEMTFFRALQECLMNVRRHSHSSTARVRIGVMHEIASLQVEDDGNGTTTTVLDRSANQLGRTGTGLEELKERLQLLGGYLEFSSTTRGTTVRSSIPVTLGCNNARESNSHPSRSPVP